MIQEGKPACFMKDKKGDLPAHVACSRHTSPDKLKMLLDVNPEALREPNNEGLTLLDLAQKHRTKSHPNQTLIQELESQMANDPRST